MAADYSTVEVADHLTDALLRVPYKAETESTGFVIDKRDLGIIMGGYLRQHLFQRDIVVDDGL